MSDRPIDINLTKGTATNVGHVPTPEEVAEYRAKLARVYDRGIVIDRLEIALPPDMHGEWVANDPSFIARMELLGFQIDTKYAVDRALNDGADGSARVGDVVFMTCPKWKKDIMEEDRKRKYEAQHLRDRRKQKEESDFLQNQATIGEDKNTSVASKTDIVTGSDITETLSKTGK